VTTTIRLRRNGPYVIDESDVRIVDWNGAEYRHGRSPVALCRCGASATKPFCDGTHKRIDFRAADAGAGAEDEPGAGEPDPDSGP
jgi:CDGSH-type Zn-finger protein